MSIKAMEKVWESSPYRGEKLLVLLALADWSSHDGICWPSYKSIAAKTRITERGAIGIVKKLVADGVLVPQIGSGRGITNQYKMNLDFKPERVNEEAGEPDGKGERGSIEGVNEEAEKGERGATPNKGTVSEPSVNRYEQPPAKPKKTPQHFPEIPESLKASPDFVEAWAMWAEHKRQKRDHLTPLAAKLRLDELAEMGVERAVKAIRHSIACNYKGIFEPKPDFARPSRAPAPRGAAAGAGAVAKPGEPVTWADYQREFSPEGRAAAAREQAQAASGPGAEGGR